MGEMIIFDGIKVPIGSHERKTIVIGADHRGFEYKERIKEVSQALNKRQKDGLNIVDLQKELITLVDTMGQLSSASKN